jgi:hypothetical protein
MTGRAGKSKRRAAAPLSAREQSQRMHGRPPSRGPDDAMISRQQDGLMFRTQEEMELALLQYMLEFNETRFRPDHRPNRFLPR